MSFGLSLIRKSKSFFVRFRLHKIVEPFSGLLLKLVYISKFSKWASQQKKVEFNDFIQANGIMPRDLNFMNIFSIKKTFQRKFNTWSLALRRENLSNG